MSNHAIEHDDCGRGAPAGKTHFLSSDYNLTVFFSLPFHPVSASYGPGFTHGHLSLALGDTVYQVHDPARLRSRFLVSRMPVTTWLFRDGNWFDADPSSSTYRHVHLYGRAEVARTAVFFAALRSFPADRQHIYEQYLEGLEQAFHGGNHRFHRVFNNCTRSLDDIFYREQWMRRGPLDFLPAVAFRRLVAGLERLRIPFRAGYFHENDPAEYRLQRFCSGLWTLSPADTLARWVTRVSGRPYSSWTD